MTVFLNILSVIAAIIGGLLVFVAAVILVLLPIKAELIVGYNNEEKFFFKLRYAAASFGISSPKKTPQKPKEPPVKKTDDPEDNKTDDAKDSKKEKKENFFSKKVNLLKVKNYIELLGYVGTFLKRFRFGEILANVVIASDDAAKTAMEYGAVTATVFPLLGKIHSEKLAKDIDVHINTDFTAKKTYADVYVEVYVRTIHILILAFKALIYLLKLKETNNGK